MGKSKNITISQFADLHGVPEEAVLNAIVVGKLKTNGWINDQEIIHPDCIQGYKFDLIGAIEYAKRKGVSSVAVYKRLDKEKFLYTLDGDIMKIDWELYKDAVFRDPSFKFRGKNKQSA